MIFAYADPPYLGCCKLYGHRHEAPFGCWDDIATHRLLIAVLMRDYPDGWALSLTAPSLPQILALCPPDVRVAAWCKTWHQIRPTTVQYAWEPLIWRGGRKDNKRAPMVRDWYACPATRGRGLVGAKPAAFNRWVLDLLNVTAADEIVDVFPGTASMSSERDRGVFDFGEAS